MSIFDPSMEPMLEMFVYETTTLLEQLDEIMLKSEKSSALSNEDINEIFRIMHTIKGSSAMMGLESISHLSHSVEDMFFIIRQNTDKINDSRIFDLIFQSSDFFKNEMELINNPDYAPADSAELTGQINDMVLELKASVESDAAAATAATEATAVATTAAATAAATAVIAAAAEKKAEDEMVDEDAVQVRVLFEAGCEMENIRAFMLISQIQGCCTAVKSFPPHPEQDSTLSQDIAANGIVIEFTPKSVAQEVYTIIESAINVRSYEVLDSFVVAEPTAEETAAAVTAAAETAKAATAAADAVIKAAEAAAAPVVTKAVEEQVNSINTNSSKNKQSLISVNQGKIDQLMDIMGEIVIAESMVANNQDIKGLALDNFNKSTRELRKLTDELQDIVMSIRMVPMSGVYLKMQRLVRDMAKKLDKKVELVTEGDNTEIDKTINDSLGDPFMHMIRNAIDHAIESPEERLALGKSEVGHVFLSAKNVGGEIVILIQDDGCGLNPEKLMKKARERDLLTKPENAYTESEIFQFIMMPGFSTNEAVTEFSGRGVGMDVVRQNLEEVGGTISVHSEMNVGTTFTMKIPLTLAIVDGMEFSVGNTVFTLPITSIKQSFKIDESTDLVRNTDGSEMILLRGECYPVVRLHSLFGVPTETTRLEDGIVILIENDRQSACLFVDELIGEEQVVVKPFPTYLAKYSIKEAGLAGCTILGDGSISLILDASNLLRRIER